MSLYVASINSGSNGNCYYVANENEAVLIDAGISCREIEKRMARLGLSLSGVKAVFISHEHSDHIRGVEVLSRKYALPVYLTPSTHASSRLRLDTGSLVHLPFHEEIAVGELRVTAFPKRHDAIDPCSFVVSGSGVNIGVLTDIGSACEHVTTYFGRCHAAFLEANYDDEMLDNGRYPFYLKQRIKSDTGHLSNYQAAQLFVNYRSPSLSHLFLSHLSKDNNCPRKVERLFREYAGNTHVGVASRDRESELYKITADHVSDLLEIPEIRPNLSVEQLKLF